MEKEKIHTEEEDTLAGKYGTIPQDILSALKSNNVEKMKEVYNKNLSSDEKLSNNNFGSFVAEYWLELKKKIGQ